MREYLADKYDVILEKGNDERGINVGFLVKKSLNVKFELKSHKHLKYGKDHGVYPAGTPIFARDLPVLYLRQQDGSNSRASEDPDLVVLGMHLKSKRPTEGDFESTSRREVEIQTAAKILQQTEEHYGGKVPVLLAGDLNTYIESKEASALRNSFDDSLSLMGDRLSFGQKVTHTFHPLVPAYNPSMAGRKFEGEVQPHQVDVQYLNSAMTRRLLKSYVYHYKDHNGEIKVYYGRRGDPAIYPKTFQERKKNPSDHMPVVAEYDMTRK